MQTTSLITLTMGLLLLTGLLLGYLASRENIPRVAAYIMGGLLFSPDLLGRLQWIDIGHWTNPLTTSALGIIAYLIGGSITLAQLRRTGMHIFGYALAEAIGAVLCVFMALYLLLPKSYAVPVITLALAFSAIAASTAPAGTIAVLHQYRARGPVSETLLEVVAFDDAIGIILFSLMMSVTVGQSLLSSMQSAAVEILGALILGCSGGYVLAKAGSRFHQGSFLLPVALGHILLVLGLAELLQFSHLLAAMALGFSGRYFSKGAGDRLFIQVEYFEELVFLIFFTLAGAHFEFKVFAGHLGLISVYFIARIIGKVAGASIGALLVGAPKSVIRWLGFGLVPQAGVAVGLALSLSRESTFSEVSTIIINVILATTFLYELLGPLITKFALQQAGELSIRQSMKE